jgi:hypothetical protein
MVSISLLQFRKAWWHGDKDLSNQSCADVTVRIDRVYAAAELTTDARARTMLPP